MEYSEQVHLFATKWIEKFRDHKISYIELVIRYDKLRKLRVI